MSSHDFSENRVEGTFNLGLLLNSYSKIAISQKQHQFLSEIIDAASKITTCLTHSSQNLPLTYDKIVFTK